MAKPPTRNTIEQRMHEARRIGRQTFLDAYASSRGSDNWYVDHERVHYDLKALWAAAHRPPIAPRTFNTSDAIAGFKRFKLTPVSNIATPRGLPGDLLGATLPSSRDDAIRAVRVPVATPGAHYQATGYWLFLVNPKRWDAEAWRATGERDLLYLVSKDDRLKMQPGDLGLMRINRQGGAPATFIAAVEVLTAPAILAESDTRFFRDPDEGAPALRTRLSVITETDQAVSAASFPNDPEFRYVHRGTPRTTIPIARAAFVPIAKALGLTGEDLATARASRTAQGVRQLEASTAPETPTQKERVSKFIERGPVGNAVKAKHKGRCQICMALGHRGIAFLKPNGDSYSEAHHVTPVSTLKAGVLSHLNIMVLCPNHHRQAHYGLFVILHEHPDHWVVLVDDRSLRIAKTTL